MKEKDEISFYIYSDNSKVTYTNNKTYTIQHNSNLQNHLSIVISNDYALDKIHSSSSYSKGLIILVSLNEENYLIHFIYDNNNHTTSKSICKSFNPSHFLLNYSQLQFCHLLFDLETKSIFYLFATNKRIFYQNVTINKPNVILDLSSFENYAINGIYTFKNGLNNNIFALLNENILIELNCKREQGNQVKILNSLLKQRKGIITPINNINVIDCQYLKEGQSILDHTVCLFDKNESNVVSLWRFNNDEQIRNVVLYYTDSLKLIALEIEGGLLRLIDYTLFKIIIEFKACYGHLTAISFSFDGNLLGIGTEDDNGYIIDIQSRQIVACLEGHKNYISEFIIELKSSTSNNRVSLNNDSSNNNGVDDNSIHSSVQTQPQPQSLNLENAKFNEVDRNILLEEWSKSPSSSKAQSKSNTPIIKKKNYSRSNSFLRIVGESQSNHLNQQKEYDIYTCGLDGNICSWEIEYKAIKRNHIDDDDQSSIPTARNLESVIEDDANPLKKKMFQYFPSIKLSSERKIIPLLSQSVGKYPIVNFGKIDSIIYAIQKEKNDCSAEQINIFCRDAETKHKQNDKPKEKRKSNHIKHSSVETKGNIVNK